MVKNSDIFYDIKKVDENCLTYAASRFKKHGLKKTRCRRYFEMKYQKICLYTLRYVQ